MASLFETIPPRGPKTRLVNVIIDTPRGSRNKFKFDEDLGCFKLSRMLPADLRPTKRRRFGWRQVGIAGAAVVFVVAAVVTDYFDTRNLLAHANQQAIDRLSHFGDGPAVQQHVVRGRKPFAIQKLESEKTADAFVVTLPPDQRTVHVLPLTFTAPSEAGTISEEFTLKVSGMNDPTTIM